MSGRYREVSTLSGPGGIELATGVGVGPGGVLEHPELFEGFLTRPDVVAAGILAVADVAGTRYADVGMAKRVANLNPVITASGDRLRLESFSACTGVHARLDVLPDGFGSAVVGFGTTNVDVNAPLQAALAGVGRAALVHLGVGTGGVRVATPEQTLTEEQVVLPERWVRAFAEVPAVAAAAGQVAAVTGPMVARVLASLPRGGVLGQSLHLAVRAGTLKAVLDPARAQVSLEGAGRLVTARRVARYATALQGWVEEHGSSVWVFTLPGARYTLHLSAGASTGSPEAGRC